MGGLGGHYAEWNKSNIMISLVHGSRKQIKKTNKSKFTDTDQVDKKNWLRWPKDTKFQL